MAAKSTAIVTGGTGFVGRHVVAKLLEQGFAVTVVARNAATARTMPWIDDVSFRAYDIHAEPTTAILDAGVPDVLVHLAWPGLPNYRDLAHVERTLASDYQFLKSCIVAGIKEVLVTGTCLEYGLQDGALATSRPTLPTTPYGLAKDTLHKMLRLLARDCPFHLRWVRLFYLYGEGQSPRSLLALLDAAIARGHSAFDMSRGDQLRDYLPIEEAARRIARWAAASEVSGVLNCCSGRPVSVRSLAEQRLNERGASLTLNLGVLPYPDYEPMAFWGMPSDISLERRAIIDAQPFLRSDRAV